MASPRRCLDGGTLNTAKSFTQISKQISPVEVSGVIYIKRVDNYISILLREVERCHSSYS